MLHNRKTAAVRSFGSVLCWSFHAPLKSFFSLFWIGRRAHNPQATEATKTKKRETSPVHVFEKTGKASRCWMAPWLDSLKACSQQPAQVEEESVHSKSFKLTHRKKSASNRDTAHTVTMILSWGHQWMQENHLVNFIIIDSSKYFSRAKIIVLKMNNRTNQHFYICNKHNLVKNSKLTARYRREDLQIY